MFATSQLWNLFYCFRSNSAQSKSFPSLENRKAAKLSRRLLLTFLLVIYIIYAKRDRTTIGHATRA